MSQNEIQSERFDPLAPALLLSVNFKRTPLFFPTEYLAMKVLTLINVLEFFMMLEASHPVPSLSKLINSSLSY